VSESVLTKRQKKVYGPRPISGWGAGAQIKAEVRFDDECGNGHNTFSITGEIYVPGRRDIEAGGCLHEEIAKAFPELAPFIKWHLVSTDGPMHYVANTVHFASDRDHFGKAAGEVSAYEYGIRFDAVPITHRVKKSFYEFLRQRVGTGDFQVVSFTHDRDPKTYGVHYSLAGYAEKWHECPFRDKTEADEFCFALNTCRVEFARVPTAWSEGKARELDKARNAAVWPEATDEDLRAPGLKERLEARLPKLMEEFRAAVESLGFTY